MELSIVLIASGMNMHYTIISMLQEYFNSADTFSRDRSQIYGNQMLTITQCHAIWLPADEKVTQKTR
jgi:hypothetical protein